jgi:hypothetical protein
MEIKDTVKVFRMPAFNIHKEDMPKIEELYVSVERIHYVGLDAHAVIIDDEGKKFIHYDVISRTEG